MMYDQNERGADSHTLPLIEATRGWPSNPGRNRLVVVCAIATEPRRAIDVRPITECIVD
jgi:hypothetical protein